MLKKLILAGTGIAAAAASALPAYACGSCGCGSSATGVAISGLSAAISAGLKSGAIAWSLPWTPFSWGMALPAMNPWSWW